MSTTTALRKNPSRQCRQVTCGAQRTSPCIPSCSSDGSPSPTRIESLSSDETQPSPAPPRPVRRGRPPLARLGSTRRNAPSTVPATSGVVRSRMRWNENINMNVMRAYYEATEGETNLSAYRSKMFSVFQTLCPTVNVSTQRLSDQVRAIQRLRLLDQSLLDRLRYEALPVPIEPQENQVVTDTVAPIIQHDEEIQEQKMRVFLLLALFGATLAREDDWQPILPESSITYSSYKSAERSLDSSPSLKILNRRPISSNYVANNKVNLLSSAAPMSDACSVYKASLNQELYFQYVEYESNLPDLKEFTMCLWMKFHNHSTDHPLFSYAVDDNPKEISFWVSNTKEASYFSMAVHGQTFFRLNYPLKLNRWYHSCQSWNGKTGEWQIWVNAERVGRGFHNRLVGHIIKGGGVAITGQEQALIYNKDNVEQLQRQAGFIGEITMLQLYHVALTAGKAHKDHKHHHVHHFRHDGTPFETATEAANELPEPQATPLGNGNFLIGNQLQRAPNLNLAGSQQMVPVHLPNGLQLQQEYVNGQLGNRIVSEQLLNSVQLPDMRGTPVSQFTLVPVTSSQSYTQPRPLGPSKGTSVLLSGSLLNPANVQYIDDTQHNVYRRESKRDKRDNPEKELAEEVVTARKDKRGLVALSDGSIVDEALLSPTILDKDEEALFQESLLHGLAGVVGNLPVQNVQKETVDEREPAEAEVKAVMQVCSGCTPEPFKKALVLSWRTTSKKLYSGAHYYKGLPICRAF